MSLTLGLGQRQRSLIPTNDSSIEYETEQYADMAYLTNNMRFTKNDLMNNKTQRNSIEEIKEVAATLDPPPSTSRHSPYRTSTQFEVKSQKSGTRSSVHGTNSMSNRVMKARSTQNITISSKKGLYGMQGKSRKKSPENSRSNIRANSIF